MSYLFTNNASTTLSVGVDGAATTFSLTDGSSFPVPAGGNTFQIVVEDASGTLEICSCTARVANTLTVVRAQEGTTAQAFSAGAVVELRLTQAVMENLAQLDGATFTGDVDLSGNSLLNAVLDTPTIDGGTITGTALRAADNGTSNEISVPNGGGAPTVGGNKIWHEGNDGPGSLLNADLLDGQEGAHYLNYTNLTNVPADFTPAAHTHVAADITDSIPTSALGSTVLEHAVETSGVVRIVTTAPTDPDGANGDIWLVVSA